MKHHDVETVGSSSPVPVQRTRVRPGGREDVSFSTVRASRFRTSIVRRTHDDRRLTVWLTDRPDAALLRGVGRLCLGLLDRFELGQHLAVGFGFGLCGFGGGFGLGDGLLLFGR